MWRCGFCLNKWLSSCGFDVLYTRIGMPYRDAAVMEVCAGLRDCVRKLTFYDNDAKDEMIRIDSLCHMFTYCGSYLFPPETVSCLDSIYRYVIRWHLILNPM